MSLPFNKGEVEGILGKTMKHPKGLTMVELIIAMGIIAILATLAYPYFRTDTLVGATRMMHNDLEYARTLAVEKKCSVKVLFEVPSDDGNALAGLYRIHLDRDDDGEIDSGEYARTRDLRKDFHDISFTANRQAAVFYPQGTSNSGTVTLTDGSDSKRVIYSWTGRIRIDGEASS
jgi:prepilin-type N-terminal cleavage/methylation domain-containing protein